MAEVVQGLWLGTELSAMERLSISSFLAQGHSYHLYVYDDVGNVPDGTQLCDANSVLDASRIFKHSGYDSYSAFSNFFRYRLLLDNGGWWFDTDVVCLKRLGFDSEYVFATEPVNGEEVPTSGILKVPAGSPVMRAAWRRCQTRNPRNLEWGEVGPRLVGELVEEFGLADSLVGHEAFCPVGYSDWQSFLDPYADLEIGDGTYTIHLWHEMWRRDGVDKNASYAPTCLYERLKRRYLA